VSLCHNGRKQAGAAYHLFTLGDMVSINAELGIKGHNGFFPCCSRMINRVKTHFHKSNLPAPHSAWLGMLTWLVAGWQACPALYALSGEFRRLVTP
jgi:hypothetical protein